MPTSLLLLLLKITDPGRPDLSLSSLRTTCRCYPTMSRPSIAVHTAAVGPAVAVGGFRRGCSRDRRIRPESICVHSPALSLDADIDMSRRWAIAALLFILPLTASVAMADSPYCDLTDEAACKEAEDCCWYSLHHLYPLPFALPTTTIANATALKQHP